MRQLGVAQAAQCLFFQLANTLAAQAKFVGDFFQGMGFATAKSKPQTQDMALTRRQFRQNFIYGFFKQVLRCRINRAYRFLIFDKVAEFAVAIVADRTLQRNSVLAGIQHRADRIRGNFHRRGDLFCSWPPAQVLLQVLGCAVHLTDALRHVKRDTYGSCFLRQGACGVGHPAINETIDDLVIYIEVVAIDGPGGILGSAGPCVVRPSGALTVLGRIRLDQADVASMESSGTLYDVVLHEMGHVIGVGTLWITHALLVGGGGSDPYFTGTKAGSEYLAAGGTHPNPVPVENTGGPGTRDAHWREADMSSELMTGWISTGSNPLSRITVGSLQDQGYGVNMGAADSYSLAPLPPGVPRPRSFFLKEVPFSTPIIVGEDEATPRP